MLRHFVAYGLMNTGDIYEDFKKQSRRLSLPQRANLRLHEMRLAPVIAGFYGMAKPQA